jgi:hypothetical protein
MTSEVEFRDMVYRRLIPDFLKEVKKVTKDTDDKFISRLNGWLDMWSSHPDDPVDLSPEMRSEIIKEICSRYAER